MKLAIATSFLITSIVNAQNELLYMIGNGDGDRVSQMELMEYKSLLIFQILLQSVLATAFILLILHKQKRANRMWQQEQPKGKKKYIFVCVTVLLVILFNLYFNSIEVTSSFNYIDIPLNDNTNKTRNNSNDTVTTTTMNNNSKNKKAIVPLAPQDMSNGTGIVLFFHIPKTGGTSMREAAKKDGQIQYYSNRYGTLRVLRQIDKWTQDRDLKHFQGQNTKVKFLEFHWGFDGVVPLDDSLRKWRQDAAANNIPFFVFTLMREPLSTYISIYNYFCIFCGSKGHVECPGPRGIDHMFHMNADNPQARWLCYGTTLFDRNLPLGNCTSSGKLERVMQEHFDHIGFVDKMNETVQVLENMGIKLKLKKINKTPKMENPVDKSKINETMMASIQMRLTVDKQLVGAARRRMENNTSIF